MITLNHSPFCTIPTVSLKMKVKFKVVQSCLTLWDPMDYAVHGILQARILEWVAFPFSRESSQPGIKPRSPALQADALPAEPQGKPTNTGAGSLSLFSGSSLTQASNQGFLHCRQILYQLSYPYPNTINTILRLYKLL